MLYRFSGQNTGFMAAEDVAKVGTSLYFIGQEGICLEKGFF
jgi:hypothetical protein